MNITQSSSYMIVLRILVLSILEWIFPVLIGCYWLIRAPPYGGCPIVISLSVHVSVTNEVFQGVFYTISYRNLKLSIRFFWVKLHIEFVFHHGDPYGSGVTCPWIFYYYIGQSCACNSFPGFFSTPFHVRTWNSSELSYIWSLHVTVFRSFCLHRFNFHIGTWNFP
jgi:hypothetical protein